MDRKVCRIDLSGHGNSFQRIHSVGDLDSGWASDCAGIARRTDPNRLTAQDVLQTPGSEHRYRLPWCDIHELRHRAGSCAGSALKTLLDLVTIGKRLNLFPKCGVQFRFCRRKGLDSFSHKTSMKNKYSNSEGDIDTEFSPSQAAGIVARHVRRCFYL